VKPATLTSARRWLPVIACLLAVAADDACGQSSWLPTSWFTPAEVDGKAMHPMAERDGPWLVLATTFRGEGARDDARRLAQELRRVHKLKAYTHEKSFDYTGTQPGLGLNPDGSPKKMRYANAENVVEVAVLVGDFATVDDARGQKILAKVKSLRPEALTGNSGKSQSFSDFRKMVGLERNTTKPPMHLAFMIPNPLLPEEFFSRQQVDRFVLDMNADVSDSLLDCPGLYSVRVATFTGSGTFDQKAIAAGEKDVELEGRLVQAAEKAHRLTVALRKAGWEAWEYHDRESSIVCVGSLDTKTVPGPQGTATVHPEIVRIVRELGPDPTRLATGVVLPRTIDGVMLDVQPAPIQVPRAPQGWR